MDVEKVVEQSYLESVALFGPYGNVTGAWCFGGNVDSVECSMVYIFLVL